MESLPHSFPGNHVHLPAPLPPQPRQRPGEKPVSAPATTPMPPEPAAGQPRLLRFTCPACFAYLELDPAAPYHGQPAPCPTCQTVILPPMVFPLGARATAPAEAPPVHVKPKRDKMAIEFKRKRRVG